MMKKYKNIKMNHLFFSHVDIYPPLDHEYMENKEIKSQDAMIRESENSFEVIQEPVKIQDLEKSYQCCKHTQRTDDGTIQM